MPIAPKLASHSPEAAWQQAAGTHDFPIGMSAKFTCPYPDCTTFAQHNWGVPGALVVYGGGPTSSGRRISEKSSISFSCCVACDREVIFLRGKVIWPTDSRAPVASADMPLEVKADFDEARQIYAQSPRGAAALLRLGLQKLCPKIGATSPDINNAIKELVANGVVSTSLQQALDAVRVIGNEAVHPGVMDLRDDQETALGLFGLLNFIVEKAITEPKAINAIYKSLPASKLKGIEDRDR